MDCEKCVCPAVVHESLVVQGKVIERHLCARCAGHAAPDPELDAEMAEFLKQAQARIVPWWEGLAGEHLQTMLHSRQECVARLDNPSAPLRSVSWQILLKRWTTDVDLVPQCKDAIRHDPDVEVRVSALYYLAALYRQSADPGASAFLADVALAPETPTRMREAAYLGLLRVHGQPIPRELLLNIKQSGSRRPYPIDWEFIRRIHSAS